MILVVKVKPKKVIQMDKKKLKQKNQNQKK